MVLALPQKDRTAHAFQRTCAGEKMWFSLTKETLLTYYEDRVLHVVGNQRMREWYAAQRLDTSVVGAALAFWENLDGGPLLPDAIVAGLESTLVAEFEAVFLLSYGQFSNTPPHVRWIDASTVDALNLFYVRFYVDFSCWFILFLFPRVLHTRFVFLLCLRLRLRFFIFSLHFSFAFCAYFFFSSSYCFLFFIIIPILIIIIIIIVIFSFLLLLLRLLFHHHHILLLLCDFVVRKPARNLVSLQWSCCAMSLRKYSPMEAITWKVSSRCLQIL